VLGGHHVNARRPPPRSSAYHLHTRLRSVPFTRSRSSSSCASFTSPSPLRVALPRHPRRQSICPIARPGRSQADSLIKLCMDPAGQAARPSPSAAGGGDAQQQHQAVVQPLAQAKPPPPQHTPPPPPHQLSRYESQKRRDWNTFLQYLRNHRPPLTLARCSGAHVIEFLKYLDQFGKTKVHATGCAYYGQPSPPLPCPCPLRQAWGSLDALIGRLRAAYEESGHPPESNPFAARAVRIYLREVRDAQAKARGIPYEKKKRKRTPTTGEASSSAVAAARDAAAAAAAAATAGGGAGSGGNAAATTTPPSGGRAGEMTGTTTAAAAAPTTSQVQ
jgi:hypothetical protein